MALKALKRGDRVAEEIKQWITEGSVRAGDKLPKEAELTRLFSVSKATAREALKSLEVQGLITVSAGAGRGATVGEVPFDRTFQLLQNYLFFRGIDSAHIYAVRRIVEPELARGAVPHLKDGDFAAMERSIAFCAPVSVDQAVALEQRQEDLHFHDVLANANPNPFLRFVGQLINELLRQLVVIGATPTHPQYHKLGRAAVAAHRAILAAARAGDADTVGELMLRHVVETERHVRKLQGVLQHKLVLDSDMSFRIRPSRKAVADER